MDWMRWDDLSRITNPGMSQIINLGLSYPWINNPNYPSFWDLSKLSSFWLVVGWIGYVGK